MVKKPNDLPHCVSVQSFEYCGEIFQTKNMEIAWDHNREQQNLQTKSYSP